MLGMESLDDVDILKEMTTMANALHMSPKLIFSMATGEGLEADEISHNKLLEVGTGLLKLYITQLRQVKELTTERDGLLKKLKTVEENYAWQQALNKDFQLQSCRNRSEMSSKPETLDKIGALCLQAVNSRLESEQELQLKRDKLVLSLRSEIEAHELTRSELRLQLNCVQGVNEALESELKLVRSKHKRICSSISDLISSRDASN